MKNLICLMALFLVACGSKGTSGQAEFKAQAVLNQDQPTPHCQAVYGPWLIRQIDRETAMRTFSINAPIILATTDRNACELLRSSTGPIQYAIASPSGPAILDSTVQLFMNGNGETFRLENL